MVKIMFVNSGTVLVAVVGLIATASSPVLTAWFAERRAASQRAARQSAELRRVIDESTQALVRAYFSYLHVMHLWERGVSPTSEEAKSAVPEYVAAYRESAVMAARLATRLGASSEVVVAYRRVQTLLSTRADDPKKTNLLVMGAPLPEGLGHGGGQPEMNDLVMSFVRDHESYDEFVERDKSRRGDYFHLRDEYLQSVYELSFVD